MDRFPRAACQKLYARANQEIESVVVRRQAATPNPVVKVEAFLRSRALGVDSDHGIQAEQGRVLALVEDPVGVLEVVGVSQGDGGDELARYLRLVEEAVEEELSVNLQELSEGGGGIDQADAWVFRNASQRTHGP